MEMKKYKLGDLLEVTRGMSLSGEYYSTEGELMRLTLGNFDYHNNCFKDDKSKDNLFFTGKVKPEFILKKGDIITPLTEQAIGLLGSTAKIPCGGKYIQSQDIGLIKCNEKLNSDYAFYLISSKLVRNQLSVAAQQTKIRHTSPDKIKACTVWIPEVSTQQKIAAVLSSLDKKIVLNSRINARLEQMAKRLYEHYFVQFDFPTADGKPYKTSGGKMVYSSELKREIPEGWEVKRLGDILQPIKRGLSYTTKEIEDFNGMPMINLACFDKIGNYRIGELKYFSGKYTDEDLLKPFDILIACTDLTQKADIIGTPIFVPCESSMFVYSTDLAKLTPLNNDDRFYLYYYLKNDIFHKYIKPFASGTTVKHLDIKGVLQYPYIQPDKEIVKKFTLFIEPFRKEISRLQADTIKLTKLRDRLLPLLMNGQVSI